ncbi:uncharacterized protein LOC131701785 [Acipenser ruthenus]|uniref:uncharacterized protein LOC131701785 n=1 Tax=Acipenser ruthenus TaxID=7906 RepID=UPI002741AA90|nr:uncharacterized protein LOC131701785 [Acipenser ruthenus]
MGLHKTRLFVLWMSLNLMAGKASSKCEREATVKTQVNGTLDSKTLIPCQFDSSLLSQATKGNTAVVWTFKKNNTTTLRYLVEIGESETPRFWDNRKGRIILFPTLSKEGNFSILLNRTRSEDQGRYLCELFDGVNCSLGVQEVQLTIRAAVVRSEMRWYIITGGGGGLGVILLLILLLACFLWKRGSSGKTDPGLVPSDPTVVERKKKKGRKAEEPIYANVTYNIENQLFQINQVDLKKADHKQKNPSNQDVRKVDENPSKFLQNIFK